MFEPSHLFIDYKKLNYYVLSRPCRQMVLHSWMKGKFMYPKSSFIGQGPKNSMHTIYVNMRNGHWTSSTGDAGRDLISLCAYIFNISQHKAALRIIETMR